MLMADMGAEVIKIEIPQSPDYVRKFPPYLKGESINYQSFNRSKLSVALDYTNAEGLAQLVELIKKSDIFVEQFRPGFLKRFGLDYDTLKTINPRLIYVSITGYGQTGPYANLAGHDLNYIAYSGVLGTTGQAQTSPTMPGVQLADIAGGSYMSVIGTLAALHARHTTGLGQQVDVSMTDAVMPLLSAVYSLYSGIGTSIPRGQLPLSGGAVNYNVYACQDNKYIALGTLEPKFWSKFCLLVGQPDWQTQMLAEPIIQAEVEALFKSQPASHWIAMGLEHDLLISPVYDLPDLAQDPHLQARNMIVEVEHPEIGKLKQIGIPIKFSGTPAKIAWAAPSLGQDNEGYL
jgi:crotonobetainyl-CoA:carnitine CoA-transferase CaiB-like acyl-CoA transferase